MLEAEGDPEFMTSFARGLAVLRCFADAEEPMTIAQASRLTGLSRPAVKRCLHTLVRLDYAGRDGTQYRLKPKVMALGYAFLSSSPLSVRAQPLLDQIRDELHESCSLGVLEEDEVHYVGRAEVSRIMSVALRTGSRLPLYCTSMGRVLLADQTRQEQEAYLSRTELRARTAKTQVEPSALMAILEQVKAEGHAIVDQELELGLLSVAVPVINANGRTIAAVNVGAQAARIDGRALRDRYLPALRRVAKEISAVIAH